MPALFHLVRDNSVTLQHQIREQLVNAILDGYLPLDEPLPSSRSFAKQLNVARNTIVLVYEELLADGYLISKERSGYYIDPDFVNNNLKTELKQETPDEDVEKVDWKKRLKVKASTQINPSLAHSWQSYPYPFVYAQLDPKLFPIDNWRKCWRDAVSVQAIRDWSSDRYDSDDPLLIEQIQKRILPKRGIHVDKEEILITLGSQQAIYLLAQLLLNRSSVFGIEDPGYVSASYCAEVVGARVKGLAVDNDGLVIGNALNECDVLYVTPSHQCPTTVTMPLERRMELLEKSNERNFIVIEDDYEMEMNFDYNPTPALKSLDKQDRVLYIGSLSKTLAPGLRMGFLVGPKELIKEARNLRQLMVRHPPLNNQRAVALFLAQGYHDALLRKLARCFQERNEKMAEALEKHLPGTFTRPTGGSSFWCRLDTSIDTSELKGIVAEHGLLIISGDSYHTNPNLPKNYIKLGFSAIDLDMIEPGVEKLSQLINEMLAKNKATTEGDS